MNKETIHCCKEMETSLNDSNIPILYSSVFRDYGVLVVADNDKTSVQPIHNCPWCAAQVPQSCFKQWFSFLKDDHALDDPRSKDQRDLIPEEFKTDEWWKKRKL